MLNIGVPEMLLILVVALIVFGPSRLPEIARQMGKFIRQFQSETNRAIEDLKRGIEPATTGVFDEPDPPPMTTEPIVEAPPTGPVAAPIPTRAPGTAVARKRSTGSRPKRATKATAQKKAAPKRPASKRPAPKKAATARRGPRKG